MMAGIAIALFGALGAGIAWAIWRTLYSQSADSDASERHGLFSLFVKVVLGCNTFACVCLLQVIFCEVIDLLSIQEQTIIFRLSMGVIVFNVLGAIPSSIIHRLLSASFGPSRHTIQLGCSCIVYFGGLYGFYILGSVLPSLNEAEGRFKMPTLLSLFQGSVHRVAFLGVIISGLMAGLGAVSAIYQSFVAKPTIIQPESIERARYGLQMTEDLLRDKKQQLQNTQEERSVFDKLRSALHRTDNSRASLQAEIDGLEMMKTTMVADIGELEKQALFQRHSRTLYGISLRAANWIFSCYCFYRIPVVVYQLWMTYIGHRGNDSQGPPSDAKDPVSSTIALVVLHLGLDGLDQDAWSRQISYILSGGVIFASIGTMRRIYIQLSRFFRRHIPSDILALVTSGLSAMYFVSVALMFRSSNAKSHQVPDIFASFAPGVDPAALELWFNATFLASVLIAFTAFSISRQFDLVESEDSLDFARAAKSV